MRCFLFTFALVAARRVSVDGSNNVAPAQVSASVSADGAVDVAPGHAGAAFAATNGTEQWSICGLPRHSSCDMTCNDFYWRYCPDWEAIALSQECFIPNANQICCDEIPAPCLGAWRTQNTEHLFCSRESDCLRPSCDQEVIYLDHLYYDTTWRHLSTCIFESSSRPTCGEEVAPFKLGQVILDALGDLKEKHLDAEEAKRLEEAEAEADQIQMYIFGQENQTVAPENTPAVQSAADALIARATATRADMANRDPDTDAAIQAKKDKAAAEAAARAANGDDDDDDDYEVGDMDWDLEQMAQTLLNSNFTGVPGRAPTAVETAALQVMQAASDPDLGDMFKRRTCQALADGRSLCRQGPYIGDCSACLTAKQANPLEFILGILRHESVEDQVSQAEPRCSDLPRCSARNAVEFADKSYCACESARRVFEYLQRFRWKS